MEKTVSERPLLDMALLGREWPELNESTYLNSGSCGIKPQSVLKAIENGWQKLNQNPTITTFLDQEPWESARKISAQLLGLPDQSLLLTPNSTYGLQMVMQSFLLKPGDELVMTDHEHGCVNTLAEYLTKTRGIVVKKAQMEPLSGSEKLTDNILQLIGPNTRLVEVSEIDCYTGWRPNLNRLVNELQGNSLPLLVDGAHTPGQGPLAARDYPFWIGSGHKWLCGPNGTGFLYVNPQYKEYLQPLCVGDRLYQTDFSELTRLEWPGTCDVVRFAGLEAACNLHLSLGQDKIRARQLQLVAYLRQALSAFPDCRIRTADIDSESSGMLAFHFPKGRLPEVDLREQLWQKEKVWIQPDFACPEDINSGMRISCHVYTKEQDIDRLIEILQRLLK
ncbi:MAG: aminotransferase class V-fold PLP-dependent enzyme [Candidatus Obscuribacterales bacterium]|nr:aminotransferase class V-fold PLP-dependent enzyme [Candidatus Obscuribacterales bacterium]